MNLINSGLTHSVVRLMRVPLMTSVSCAVIVLLSAAPASAHTSDLSVSATAAPASSTLALADAAAEPTTAPDLLPKQRTQHPDFLWLPIRHGSTSPGFAFDLCPECRELSELSELSED